MARSFWGFGYSQPSPQPQANTDDTHRKDRSPTPSGLSHVVIPPNGTFASPTTAVTQASSDLQQSQPRPMGSSSAAAAAAAAASHASNRPSAAGPGGLTQASSALTRTGALAGPNRTNNINIPANAQIQGKLKVRVTEARGLPSVSATSNPYVVVQCSTSEHISRSANTGAPVADPNSGSGIAIPNSRGSSMRSTASRSQSQSHQTKPQTPSDPENPKWDDDAIFDVTSNNSDLEVTVYDAGQNDICIGHVKIQPDFQQNRLSDQWYPLQPRPDAPLGSNAGKYGQLHISLRFEHTGQQHFGPSDFQVLRLIGRGTFGQVYQVRKRDSGRVYAMKVLSKRVIVREKEIAHTIGERDILVRTSGEGSAFLVGLKFSFQTNADLYLVTDYMSGGELFWHLQREGRFSEPRAKFYIAELIVALEHLHHNHIVYRDLKPENILLDASGHVALCDFGLSKANLNNGTTNTFCGTTEYLAPEVLLDDKGYTKMVDFWSLGVLIFEMCCGWSPFYAEDNQQMYKNIAFGKVRFPKDALSPEGRDFVKGLLNRNPKHRLGATNDARELMAHPFFRDIDWDMLKKKQIPPPYKPHVSSEDDTSTFDPEFTTASTSVLTRTMEAGTTPLSPGIQDKFKGFTFVDDTLVDEYLRQNKNAGPGPGSVSAQSQAPISGSFRPTMAPKMGRDEGIDLYDENEIKLSHSHYDSGIKHKFANSKTQHQPDDDMMRMDEEDEDMLDDDGETNYNDFVEGQGFEM